MAKDYPDDATSAAVIGCGPVGLMAILAAQAQGAQQASLCLSTCSSHHLPYYLHSCLFAHALV